jgi:hypothetical protein
MSDVTQQRIALYAMVAAVTAIVLAPLVALAYFATSDGVEQLAVSTVSAWAEPARTVLSPLLTWASPDRVYATYTQVLALAFPAVFLTALATRARRPLPRKRSEKVGWGISLTGYGLFGVGVLLVSAMLIGGDTNVPLVDVAFLAMMFPGLLVGLIGSTVLGVTFLRTGHEPRVTAWLLALAFPLWIVGSFVLGHNGLGIVPLFIAWAAAARSWSTDDASVDAAPRDPASRVDPAVIARIQSSTVAVAASLLALLLLAGCGGQDQADAVADAVADGSSLQAAQAICDDAGEQIQGVLSTVQGKPSPEQAQQLDRDLVPVLQAAGDDLAEVDGGESAGELEGFVAAFAVMTAAMGEAAEDEDVAEQLAEHGAPLQDLDGPARDLGLQACLPVPGSGDADGADIGEGVRDVQVEGSEYEFTSIPEEVFPGSYAITFVNEGDEPHELSMVRLKAGTTASSVIEEQEAGADPATLVEDFLGSTGSVEPGESGAITVDLEDGASYGYACLIEAPDGSSHASLGMLGDLLATVEAR